MSPTPAEINAALREIELAELEEAQARDDLLDFFLMFHAGWHADTFHSRLCRRLMRFMRDVEDRKFPCLIVEAPPQHGKSSICSRAFPAWMIGHHPDWPIALASYAASLASGHGRWIRNTTDTQRYRNIFPGVELAEDSQAKDFFHINKGGQFRAIGIGGGLSGQPARVLITDDPYEDMEAADSLAIRDNVESWWETVAMARMAEGGGKLLMLTRWRLDDLAGYLKDREKAHPKADKWDTFSFEAIASQDEYEDGRLIRREGEPLCPRVHSIDDLERKRAGMSKRNWLAMYQQRPIADEGGYFKATDLRTYTETPRVGEVYLAGDLAYKTGQNNDRTCFFPFGMTEAGDVVVLPDIVYERMETDKTIDKILELVKRYKINVCCMGRDAYQAIGPVLRRVMNERRIWCQIKEVPEKKDKELRARSFQSATQMRRVLFPAGELWEDRIKPELLAFPGGKHDDSVDAGSNMFWLMDELSQAKPEKPKPEENKTIQRWKERSQWQGERDDGAIKPLFGE